MLEILDKNYNNALSAVSKFALPAAHRSLVGNYRGSLNSAKICPKIFECYLKLHHLNLM